MQPNLHGSMTLKALLEDPNLKNPPLRAQSSDSLKLKKEDDGNYSMYNYGSAFLGSNLWENTMDNSDFNLEYMDLDEFLLENGIPLSGEEPINIQADGSPSPKSKVPIQTNSPRQFLNIPHSPPAEDKQPYKLTIPPIPNSFPSSVLPIPTLPNTPTNIASPTHSHHSLTNPHTPGSKSPSPPVSPFNVDYQVSEQDLALASIPDYGEKSTYRPKWQQWSEDSRDNHGQQHNFDPRKRNFSEEELKPQPIIKKSKKIFVPEDLKDDKYWHRRHKNNFAAKRSRDARRVKENQIAMRASFLEKENGCLRDELAKLRKENAQLKGKVDKYETAMSSPGIPTLTL